MPKSKHKDLDFIVDQLDWDRNVDPNFKDNHYLEPVPIADTRQEGFVDRWIVYGKVDGGQLFTAKELTVEPGVKCTIADTGACGLICGRGWQEWVDPRRKSCRVRGTGEPRDQRLTVGSDDSLNPPRRL